MSDDAQLIAKAGVDTTQADRGLQNFEGKVSKTSQAITKIGNTLKGAFAVGVVISAAKAVANYATSVQDGARETQLSTTAYQALTFAARNNGAEQGQLDQGLQKLNQTRAAALEGDEKAAQSFAKLGISLEQLATLDTAQTMEAIGQAVVNANDPTTAFNATTEILGRNAEELQGVLQALGTDGFAGIAQQAQDANAIIGEDTISTTDELKDMWDNAMVSITGWVSGAALGWIDTMKDAVGRIVSFFANIEWGELISGNFGEELTKANEISKQFVKDQQEQRAQERKQKQEARQAKREFVDTSRKQADQDKVKDLRKNEEAKKAEKIATVESKFAEQVERANEQFNNKVESIQKKDVSPKSELQKIGGFLGFEMRNNELDQMRKQVEIGKAQKELLERIAKATEEKTTSVARLQ